MFSRLLTTAAVLTVAVGGASAQSTTGPASSTQNGTQQSASAIPQEIKQKLSADGFTNIQVVPGSYLVSAKDKNGDPVMMVIGPHSMTILTELPGANSSTTGTNPNLSSGHDTNSSTSK